MLKTLSSPSKQGKKSDEVEMLQMPWSATSRASCIRRVLDSSTPNSHFEANEADLLRRLHFAQMDYDDFRSESPFLAPDRHRWQEHESLPALGERE